jgi:Formin Homology 2 Domain
MRLTNRLYVSDSLKEFHAIKFKHPLAVLFDISSQPHSSPSSQNEFTVSFNLESSQDSFDAALDLILAVEFWYTLDRKESVVVILRQNSTSDNHDWVFHAVLDALGITDSIEESNDFLAGLQNRPLPINDYFFRLYRKFMKDPKKYREKYLKLKDLFIEGLHGEEIQVKLKKFPSPESIDLSFDVVCSGEIFVLDFTHQQTKEPPELQGDVSLSISAKSKKGKIYSSPRQSQIEFRLHTNFIDSDLLVLTEKDLETDGSKSSDKKLKELRVQLILIEDEEGPLPSAADAVNNSISPGIEKFLKGLGNHRELENGNLMLKSLIEQGFTKEQGILAMFATGGSFIDSTVFLHKYFVVSKLAKPLFVPSIVPSVVGGSSDKGDDEIVSIGSLERQQQVFDLKIESLNSIKLEPVNQIGPASSTGFMGKAAPPPPPPISVETVSGPSPAVPSVPSPPGVPRLGKAVPPPLLPPTPKSSGSGPPLPPMPKAPPLPFNASAPPPPLTAPVAPLPPMVLPLGRKLHWKPLNERNIKDTLWENLSGTDDLGSLPEDLKMHFGEANTKPDEPAQPLIASSQGPNQTESSKVVTLLSAKRAQNIAVVISRLKTDALLEALTALHSSIVTAEETDKFQQILPSDEELFAFQHFPIDRVSSLRDIEKKLLPIFLLPRLSQRLKFLTIKITLPVQSKQLIADISCFSSSCDELKNSEKLRKVLHCILLMGNFMNHGGAIGVKGFSIESLSKLLEFRSGTVTSLHIVCAKILRETPEIADLITELPSIASATKISTEGIAQVVNSYKSSLSEISKELENLIESTEYNEAAKDSLKSLHSDLTEITEKLVSSWSETTEKLLTIRKYFGEDPKRCSVEDFFTVLNSFTQSFHAIIAEIRRNPKKFHAKIIKNSF